MARVIVNASAAKTGGAREILRSFLREAEGSGHYYYVLCPSPSEFVGDSSNVKFCEIETSGFLTYFFSVFLVFFYCFRFCSFTVLSLNNVNCPLVPKKITYFHQEKAVAGRSLRFFLVRLAVRLSFGAVYVVQTQRVKSLLHEFLGVDNDRILVRWPGVRRVMNFNGDEASSVLRSSGLVSISDLFKSAKVALLPVYDASSNHKDFIFFSKLKSELNARGVVTISLCAPGSNVADFDLGIQSREVMDALYCLCDYMVVISKQETLCLPIFEFIQTGKPVVCRDADYIRDLTASFPDWLSSVQILKSGFNGWEVDRFVSTERNPLSADLVRDVCRGNWTLI